jgi:opacity protein-like surface antigen
MKKIYALLIMLCAATPASAGIVIDFYAGLTGGMGGTWANSDNGAGQSYGAVLGVDIPLIRAEAEYNFLNRQDMNVHVGMLNGYIKMPMPTIKPYLGGGVGQVFGGKLHSVSLNSATAYQIMLGVQIDVPTTPLVFDAETRVLFAQDILPGVELTHWDARLKLRYMF